VLVARHVPDGADDHLLRRADKHPNARGAEMLGLRVLDLQRGGGAGELQSQLGSDSVLLTVGFNTHVESIAPLWSSPARVIALSGCQSALTEAADLVIPGRTFAEKEGIVVNFEGHAQLLRPAIETGAETEWKIIDATVSSLIGGASHASIAHVRQAIREAAPAFADVDLLKLGLTVRVSRKPSRAGRSDARLLDLLIILLKAIFIFGFALTLLPLLIWFERKGSAFIQDRAGPTAPASSAFASRASCTTSPTSLSCS
jgi:NADH dehydrogenase/NADH:ubiquinone oxidoreductase subunit G